jgi:SAM-dependent methyltransferase
VAEDHFDEPVAARYDDVERDMFEPTAVEPAVALLAELAQGGAALEFGVGTGRIALPLQDSGVPVHGVDLSAAMLQRLRAKPGAERLRTTRGDFAQVRVPGRFRLVYLVFNTIMNLTTQDEQVDCFRNAARHLAPGGRFLVEVMVPQLQRLTPGETIRLFTVEPDHLGFDEYRVIEQHLVSHHVYLDAGRAETRALPFRYVWPAELDLMARLAGLTRTARYGDWNRNPFTATSTQHVSVWQAP